MTARRRSLLLLAATVAPSCAVPEALERPPEGEAPGQHRVLMERQRLAASGRHLVPSRPGATFLSPATMLDSLDIPAAMNPTFLSLVSPDPEAALDRTNLGALQPRNGATFLVLSTGRSGNDALTAEPGFDFAPAGVDGDVVTFRFRVDVPPHVNRMSFDYTFLSAESPDFIGSEFNDTFVARVSDTLGADRVVATASVNSSTFHPASENRMGATPFTLYTVDPLGVDDVFGVGELLDAGTTDLQHVDVPIASGGQIVIEFDIRDLGDGILDSAVLIDNLAFSAIEVVDPLDLEDPIDDLIGDDGRVLRGVPELAERGRPVHSVAADGVTQVLLRSRVAGPGQATFTLASGSAADGELSPNEDPLDWGTSATVDAVDLGGAHYVFALYRGPASFDAGGHEAAPTRTTQVALTYTPATGTGFTQDLEIGVVRPPVIVVPDIWSSCLSWQDPGSLLTPGATHPFTVACAEYRGTASRGLVANRDLVPDAIDRALKLLRDTGIAATQADLVGHGVGGLLARRYIDEAGFVRAANFNAGDIHRLITLNTPHLGARFADEIVRFRDFTKANDPATWENIKDTLRGLQANVLLDNEDGDVVFDDLMTDSALIDEIGRVTTPARDVQYHALFSTGGRNIPRAAVRPHLGSIDTLVTNMENYHPKTRDLTTANRQRLIYGSSSFTFCGSAQATPDDQHDLFATTWEQQGGLTGGVTSEFTVTSTALTTGHYRLQNDAPHTDRLIALLNAPTGDAAFAPSMPSPGDVARVNNCPMTIPFAPEPPGLHALASLQGTVEIGLPAPGQTVAPGSEVLVSVQTGGLEPESVLIVGPGRPVLLEAPPFKGTVTIPPEMIGEVSLRAIAYYGQGIGAFSQFVPLIVEVPAVLTAIEVINGDAVLRRPGATQQLTVVGVYDDGIRRDLTAGQGLVYAVSSLSPVVTVTNSGRVTAIGPGHATLAIRSGALITSINIEVGATVCGDEIVDPGEECDDGNATPGDGCDAACQSENQAPVAVCESPSACNDPGACSAAVALGAGSSDPNDDPLTITQSPAGPYAVGQHEVAVSVSDGTLEAQCTSQLEVLDCEAPSLTCPTDFTAECTANGGAVIDPPAASATDNCGVATVHPPAAGHVPVGVGALTYTASDPAGNGASCTTQVTVQDTIAPSITCPAPTVAECTGNGAAVVDPGDAAATDACALASVTDPGPASYPLGTTPVTYTALDAEGHQTSCSTSVTVQDTIAPSITCPAPVVAECADPSGAFVQPGQATSEDACTAVTVTGPSPGTYPPGTTDVTYTSQDATGHTSSCSSTIQVVDTTAPQVSVTPPPPLWPPNHWYRTISLDDCNIVVTDGCGGGPLPPSTYQPAITCVTSDEPDNVPGGSDGNTVNDIVILDDTTVKVRAERRWNQDGRIYKIHFRVRDAAGNLQDGVCPVIVPVHSCEKKGDKEPECLVGDSGVAHQVCQ